MRLGDDLADRKACQRAQPLKADNAPDTQPQHALLKAVWALMPIVDMFSGSWRLTRAREVPVCERLNDALA